MPKNSVRGSGTRPPKDERTGAAPVRMKIRLPRPTPDRWSRGRRLFFLLVFGLAVSLGVRAVFGEKGLVEWWRLEKETARLDAEVAKLRTDLAFEREMVRDLRDGTDEIERQGREKLGMARAGEVVYLLPVELQSAAEESPDESKPNP